MDPASSSRTSRPWALLWLGGASAAVWIPLLLADSLPLASTAAAPSALVVPAPGPSAASLPQPLVATKLTQAPAPLVVARLAPRSARPRPWLASERRAASPMAPLLPRQRVETAKPKKVLATAAAPSVATAAAMSAVAPAPTRQQPLPGSVLLGGPLTLASLHEKPMVPAARIEQALRARSADRLAAVPLPWRPSMEALIQGQQRVLPAEVVHLPAPHLQTPEAYPMAVHSDGVAETSLTPSAPSRQALARWAERQSPTPQGSVRPVIVVLEPMAAMAQPYGRSVVD